MSTVRRMDDSVAAIVASAADRVRRERSGRTRSVHLDRAVAALAVAEAADRLAREEIVAARDRDEVSWEDVGSALGISRQSAHERFRTGPDGMHSRLFKGKQGGDQTGNRSGSGISGKATSGSKARRRPSAARS